MCFISTLLSKESPVHQMKRLESLLSMAKKKNRREAIMALGEKYFNKLNFLALSFNNLAYHRTCRFLHIRMHFLWHIVIRYFFALPLSISMSRIDYEALPL